MRLRPRRSANPATLATSLCQLLSFSLYSSRSPLHEYCDPTVCVPPDLSPFRSIATDCSCPAVSYSPPYFPATGLSCLPFPHASLCARLFILGLFCLDARAGRTRQRRRYIYPPVHTVRARCGRCPPRRRGAGLWAFTPIPSPCTRIPSGIVNISLRSEGAASGFDTSTRAAIRVAYTVQALCYMCLRLLIT